MYLCDQAVCAVCAGQSEAERRAEEHDRPAAPGDYKSRRRDFAAQVPETDPLVRVGSLRWVRPESECAGGLTEPHALYQECVCIHVHLLSCLRFKWNNVQER